jgi:plasmid stabilization system protein ParE
MAYRVELSRRAEMDLRRIFGFINAAESAAAADWFFGLQDHIQSLTTLADRGTITDYDPALRYLLYGNKPHIYRILYRINPSSSLVRIVHIRHGARKPLKSR